MIAGAVTADREAVVRTLVYGAHGYRRKIEAQIDTGFDGWLSLPPEIIQQLHLPWRRRSRALLADGSESIFDIYEATIIWDRGRRRIPIDETHTSPMIGMALLDGFELRIQVKKHGKVTIRRMRK